MAGNALKMESESLAEARAHDELFGDDFYEAATDNEESDVPGFSSHDGRDTDGDAGIGARLEAKGLHFLVGPGGSFPPPWPVLVMGGGS